MGGSSFCRMPGGNGKVQDYWAMEVCTFHLSPISGFSQTDCHLPMMPATGGLRRSLSLFTNCKYLVKPSVSRCLRDRETAVSEHPGLLLSSSPSQSLPQSQYSSWERHLVVTPSRGFSFNLPCGSSLQRRLVVGCMGNTESRRLISPSSLH